MNDFYNKILKKKLSLLFCKSAFIERNSSVRKRNFLTIEKKINNKQTKKKIAKGANFLNPYPFLALFSRINSAL